MRTSVHAVIALVMASAFGAAHASTDLSKASELAKANGCYSCHSADEKVVGPSFKSIAAKYAGDPTAAAGLAQSIQNGSRGKWGRIPMPPHGSMSSDDLKTLANWVMTFKD